MDLLSQQSNIKRLIMNVKKRALALGSVLVLFAATSNAQTWSEIWQDTIDLKKSSWDVGVKFGLGGTTDRGIGGATFEMKPSKTGTPTNINNDNWRILAGLGVFVEGRFGKYVGVELDVLPTGLFPAPSDFGVNKCYGGGLASNLAVKWFPMGYSRLDGGLEILGGLHVDTPWVSTWWTDTRFNFVGGLGYTLPRDILLVGGSRIQVRKTSAWSRSSKMNNVTVSLSKSLVGSLGWVDMDEE